MMKILTRGAGWVLALRESASAYERGVVGSAAHAAAVHALLRDRICRELVEVMYVLCLDGRNRVTVMSEVARGGLHGCAVSARDILRPACAVGASAIVLVHNHPSGDPTPSLEDVQMTGAVRSAAEAIGIPLVGA